MLDKLITINAQLMAILLPPNPFLTILLLQVRFGNSYLKRVGIVQSKFLGEQLASNLLGCHEHELRHLVQYFELLGVCEV